MVACWVMVTGARSARAEDTIAIMPLGLADALPVSASVLEAAVVQGLAVAARPVVLPSQTARRLNERGVAADCRTPVCWAQVGAALGSSHLLVAKVETAGTMIKVSVRGIDVNNSGRVAAVEQNECEATDCPLAELLRLSTWEVARKTFGVVAAAPRQLPGAAASPPTSLVATVPIVQRESPYRGRPLWPVALVGVGVAGVVAGLVLLRMDGACADTARCNDAAAVRQRGLPVYDQKAAGWLALTGGIAATAVGGVWLLGQYHEAGPSLVATVTPGAVGLSGRF